MAFKFISEAEREVPEQKWIGKDKYYYYLLNNDRVKAEEILNVHKKDKYYYFERNTLKYRPTEDIISYELKQLQK